MTIWGRVTDALTASLHTTVDRFNDWKTNPVPAARIAVNMRPVRSSWGGGNQWLTQITRWLRSSGYSVCFDLNQRVDGIILAHAGQFQTVTFGGEAIRAYRVQHPEVWCLHRVNENSLKRHTAFMDQRLAQANTVADHTVFISSWLRGYHAARWFDLRRPQTVIWNGADPRLYYPLSEGGFVPGGVMRLVTHHWSDNWMKGFDVYQAIDHLIASGRLPQTELWVIGRWPTTIQWKAAKTFGPTTGAQLACLLRRCHVYVTASRWESGGMHLIEGVQCGLPVLYHLDGGGLVEKARPFGIGFREDIRSAILEMRERYLELRTQVLRNRYTGDQMCRAYGQVIAQLLSVRSGRSSAGWVAR